ncbi:MAG: dipeptidase PepE [Holophagales bacterium]|nr:MAG: dipeptidase PepE [Holophagales bacterium]
MRRLLLLSNSTSFGRGLLDHAAEELADFLAPCRRVAFVPFALADRDGYAERIRARLAALDLAVDAVADGAEGHRTLLEAEAVFVGGGNTFRLLSTLQRRGLLPLLAERARAGMPYVGSSAGTNLAGPTIRTTNDMPIVEPTSLDALGLVPFQINPHYLDPDPASTHMGETREQRLREFHEENATPVLALREGAWLRVEGGRARLGGLRGARLFRRGAAPEELLPGAALDRLLEG